LKVLHYTVPKGDPMRLWADAKLTAVKEELEALKKERDACP